MAGTLAVAQLHAVGLRRRPTEEHFHLTVSRAVARERLVHYADPLRVDLDVRVRRALRKRHSFLSFPYVCPEPVLVK
jgi:hypothetical protein